MSVRTRKITTCDCCGCDDDFDNMHFESSLKSTGRRLKKNVSIRHIEGKDLCPECMKFLKGFLKDLREKHGRLKLAKSEIEE